MNVDEMETNFPTYILLIHLLNPVTFLSLTITQETSGKFYEEIPEISHNIQLLQF